MPTYRRKPTPPIEAAHYDGIFTRQIADFLGEVTEALPPENGKHCWDEPSMTLRVWNSEERQHIQVPAGHWIIKGLRGEYYPCSEEVFEASYEEVMDLDADLAAADADLTEGRVRSADEVFAEMDTAEAQINPAT